MTQTSSNRPTPTEQTALAIAQRRLLQARENDRAQHPPVQIGRTLGELTGSAPVRRARMYATPAQVAALGVVRSTPALIAAVHAEYCSGGLIVTEDDRGEKRDLRCPICERVQTERHFATQAIASGIEGRYLEVEWADLELLPPLDRGASATRDIGALIRGGASLLLYGEQTGSGKTQTAMLIGKTALRAGFSVGVRNMARLALDVRESYRSGSSETMTEKAALLALTEPDLLVIDDLGAGESETAAVERRLLFLALDDRQMQRKPTIVTTNLLLSPPPGEQRRDPQRPLTLTEVLGARVLARLQPLTILHVNHGVNFRTRKGAVSW